MIFIMVELVPFYSINNINGYRALKTVVNLNKNVLAETPKKVHILMLFLLVKETYLISSLALCCFRQGVAFVDLQKVMIC